MDESYDNDDNDNMAQDDPNDVYYEDKTTDDESDYTSEESYESLPKKKSKTKIKSEKVSSKQKTPAKTKKSSSSSSYNDTPSTSKQIKTEKRTNKTVYTPLAPVPPVLLQPIRATSTITTASSMVIAQLQTPEQKCDDAPSGTTTDETQVKAEPQVKTEPKPRKKYEKLPKQCTVCGLIVRRLRDHMKGHPDALEFKCQHCNRKYLTQAGLERHMDTQHADR